MFIESPFRPETTLRFIHNPIQEINSWEEPRDPYEQCVSVLVPDSVKRIIDSIFQQIYGNTVKQRNPEGNVKIELDFPLGLSYGEVFTKVIKSRCEEDNLECIEICTCKSEKSRIWAHKLYHEILERCAKWNGQTKKKFLTSLNLEQTSYQQWNPIWKDFQWLTLNAAAGKDNQKRYVLEEKKALNFVFASLFSQVGHLDFAGIENDFRGDLLLEDLFKDCINGKCNYKIKKVEWESKSEVEGEPDVTSVNLSRPMAFIKAPSYRSQNKMVPRSRIVSYRCKCSDEHGESILINHGSTEKEGRDIGRCRHKIKGKGKQIKNFTCNTAWKKDALTCSNPKCKGKVKDNRIETVIEQSFVKYFMKVLPNRAVGNRRESAQAAVAAKLMTARVTGKALKGVLKDSKDRHSKGQLRNTLNSYGSVMAYWPDLEDVQTLIEPRREKAKVICRLCRRQYSGNVKKCKNCGGETIPLAWELMLSRLHIALTRSPSNNNIYHRLEQEDGR